MSDKQLTGKQKLFVEYYLEYMNATKAAKLAGYSDKTAYSIGSRMLKNVEIRTAIDAALAERIIGMNEALARLADHARGDMADFAFVWTAEDLEQHPNARLVKKIERTITTNKHGETEEKLKLELYDAQSALVTLLKETRLDDGKPTERVEVDDSLTDEQRTARLATLLDAARARRDGQVADGESGQ